ncbi:galactokinase [Haemophilus parahaemolyticus]|uniref:Galactokinase n=2 Tax=Haemophilus parahaemolyticus TaxID=735 RepID=A0AAE6MPR6_HAEPH|nr:galactokinase [Haemophilus parahaemolyticus]EIJ72508.1 galactokinase [Haemophilus parahaemolyticus HK385]OOR97361.1 galactokinase [Haemophilus parahaemolyticus]QEN11534.1 galactokinase [Haemophilus parahaemolyticus]QRP12735.1 galactokinase [Haemophilus parahaemolyticus]STO66451.1 galactokinase [Haemophilus parahaemolyticus HK385]
MTPQQLSQQKFTEHYGYNAEQTVFAPGRVNIIGEHTDYNDGFVMPCAINYGMAVSFAKRNDSIWRVYAIDINEQDEFDLSQDFTQSEHKWANYVRGVVKYVQEQCPEFKQGADLVMTSDVPMSSGLSSSAALEISIGKTCQVLGNLPLSLAQIALIGQKAENKFVGANCGNMDQLTSALGHKDHLIMIDCRSLEITPTPVPHGYSIAIINSNVKHDLVTGEYNSRRQECEQAAKFFGVKALRDVTPEQFHARENELKAESELAYKRAKHVVYEDQRVLDAVAALKANDMVKLGQLMGESHDSMRDDFEITIPEIDYLVELAQVAIGKNGGARMTGGGFGGCIVCLVPNEKVEALRQLIADNYEKQTGIKETFYLCTAGDGVRVVS